MLLFHVDFPVREEDVIGEGEIDEIGHIDGSIGYDLRGSFVPDIAAFENLTGIEGSVLTWRPTQRTPSPTVICFFLRNNAIDQASVLSLS